MRTATFLSVYNDIVTRHGLDPLGDAITHDTARAITKHMNDRIITAWQMRDWPDLMRTEERAYRAAWSPFIQYQRAGEDGMPDEVYYVNNATYYRVRATAPTDPPAGEAYPPTVSGSLWDTFTPATTFVGRDQIGMRPMGQVFGVYKTNPSLPENCSSDICLRFRPSEKGVTICDGSATTVFVQYLLPVPQYTMVPYIPGKSYAAGDTVFWAPSAGDGNCYTCTLANNNQLPGNQGFWVLQPVPARFAHYLDQGTYSDTLIETFASGEDQVRLARAQAADARATASIEGMIDDLLEQGQKHHYVHHLWWHVTWRYDGTIQWPSSGWCSTEPWSGNIVYLLQAAPFVPTIPGPSFIEPPEMIYLPEIVSLT